MIGLGCGELDDAERVHDRQWHAVLADAEVPSAALGLCAPIAVGRDFDWTEAVGLGARGRNAGFILLFHGSMPILGREPTPAGSSMLQSKETRRVPPGLFLGLLLAE